MRIFITAALVLAACDSGGHMTDIQPTLRFADRSDAEIARLVQAALGKDLDAALLTLDTLENGDACPNATTTATSLELVGGCTRATGLAVDGTATATLVKANPLDVSLDHLAVTTLTTGASYDGHAHPGLASSATPGHPFHFAAGCQFEDADLTVDRDRIAVRSDLALSCRPDPAGICDDVCVMLCSLQGSGVELVGVGGALVSGGWRYVEMTSACGFRFGADGPLELRGADRVVVAPWGRGCVQWTLEGTNRSGTAC